MSMSEIIPIGIVGYGLSTAFPQHFHRFRADLNSFSTGGLLGYTRKTRTGRLERVSGRLRACGKLRTFNNLACGKLIGDITYRQAGV